MQTRREILNSARAREVKDRRKRALKIRLYLCLFLSAALLTGIVLLSRISKISISTVNIAGNNAITSGEILAVADQELSGHYLFVIPKRDIFIYPKAKIKAAILRNFKRISKVDIRINNLKEITITVSEREGKYLWCESAEKCWFADGTGYIFDDAPNFSGAAYPEISGGLDLSANPDPIGQTVLDNAEFERLVKFYSDAGTILSPVKFGAITIEPDDYKFSIIGSGGYLIFKKENDFDKILENLDSAANSEPLKTDLAKNLPNLLYLDLRFDDKVYFKFSGQAGR
jgi:hypothetical protein